MTTKEQISKGACRSFSVNTPFPPGSVLVTEWTNLDQTKRFQQLNPWTQFYILRWTVEDVTKGVKILLEDEQMIGLYTLCLSSNTARPLDGVGVPRKA